MEDQERIPAPQPEQPTDGPPPAAPQQNPEEPTDQTGRGAKRDPGDDEE